MQNSSNRHKGLHHTQKENKAYNNSKRTLNKSHNQSKRENIQQIQSIINICQNKKAKKNIPVRKKILNNNNNYIINNYGTSNNHLKKKNAINQQQQQQQQYDRYDKFLCRNSSNNSIIQFSVQNTTMNNTIQKNHKYQYKYIYLQPEKAAIIIQKIWRGFMTRKLLENYIKKQQPKLINALVQCYQRKKSIDFNRDSFQLSSVSSIKLQCGNRAQLQIGHKLDQQEQFNDQQSDQTIFRKKMSSFYGYNSDIESLRIIKQVESSTKQTESINRQVKQITKQIENEQEMFSQDNKKCIKLKKQEIINSGENNQSNNNNSNINNSNNRNINSNDNKKQQIQECTQHHTSISSENRILLSYTNGIINESYKSNVEINSIDTIIEQLKSIYQNKMKNICFQNKEKLRKNIITFEQLMNNTEHSKRMYKKGINLIYKLKNKIQQSLKQINNFPDKIQKQQQQIDRIKSCKNVLKQQQQLQQQQQLSQQQLQQQQQQNKVEYPQSQYFIIDIPTQQLQIYTDNQNYNNDEGQNKYNFENNCKFSQVQYQLCNYLENLQIEYDQLINSNNNSKNDTANKINRDEQDVTMTEFLCQVLKNHSEQGLNTMVQRYIVQFIVQIITDNHNVSELIKILKCKDLLKQPKKLFNSAEIMLHKWLEQFSKWEMGTIEEVTQTMETSSFLQTESIENHQK